MNGEIKKENANVSEKDLVTLTTSNRKSTIIDVRTDFITTESDNRNIVLSDYNEYKRKNNYHWEENPNSKPKRKNPIKKIVTVPQAVQSNIPIYRPGMRRGIGGYAYGGVNVAGVSDVFNSSGNAIGARAQEGKYGIIKFSDTYKDGPLVFVIGGVKIEGETWEPGMSNAKHKEGYMWEQGFNNLNNFHVYVCKTAYNVSSGWKECLSILSSKSIKITKKILVGFSLGASTMHGVFDIEPASNWSIIHIIGSFMPKSGDADKHVNIINGLKESGRVFYFQVGGLDKESEGATVSNKKKIGSLLAPSNIINTSSHNPDGPFKSSSWIKQNIKLNGTTVITQGGKSITVQVVSGNPIPEFGAKYKGETGTKETATTFVPQSNGGKLVQNYKPIPDGTDHKSWSFIMMPGAKSLDDVRAKPIPYENGNVPSNVLLRVDGECTAETCLMYYTAVSAYLAMKNAAAKEGVMIRYSNCYRPLQKQLDNWKKNPNPQKVAKPKYVNGKWVGTSNHGLGKAIDISQYQRYSLTKKQQMDAQKWVAINGGRFGWYWGDAPSEDWHFVYVL